MLDPPIQVIPVGNEMNINGYRKGIRLIVDLYKMQINALSRDLQYKSCKKSVNIDIAF